MFDSMHQYFANGICSSEMLAFQEKFSRVTGVSLADLQRSVQEVHWICKDKSFRPASARSWLFNDLKQCLSSKSGAEDAEMLPSLMRARESIKKLSIGTTVVKRDPNIITASICQTNTPDWAIVTCGHVKPGTKRTNIPWQMMCLARSLLDQAPQAS